MLQTTPQMQSAVTPMPKGGMTGTPQMAQAPTMGGMTAGGLQSATPSIQYGAASNGSQAPSFSQSISNAPSSMPFQTNGGYRPPVQSGIPSSQPQYQGNQGGNYGMSQYDELRDSSYNQAMRQLDPQMAQQNRAFEQQMQARGISPGTDAYNDAYANISRGQNDLMSNASFGSQAAALQAQGQFAGQDIQREGLANQYNIAGMNNYQSGLNAQTAANASMSNAQTGANASMYNANMANELGQAQLMEQGRQFGINDLFRTNQLNEGARQFDSSDVFRNQQLDQQGLLGMGNLFLGFGNQDLQRQGLQMGANNNWFGQGQQQLGNAPNASFTPTGGLVENTVGAGQALGNANAQGAAGIGNMIGSAASLASLFSDKRLKKNIKFLSNEHGINIYEYEYKNKEMGIGKQIGVMAQEVMKIVPDAVKKVKGMFVVDYRKLGLI